MAAMASTLPPPPPVGAPLAFLPPPPALDVGGNGAGSSPATSPLASDDGRKSKSSKADKLARAATLAPNFEALLLPPPPPLAALALSLPPPPPMASVQQPYVSFLDKCAASALSAFTRPVPSPGADVDFFAANGGWLRLSWSVREPHCGEYVYHSAAEAEQSWNLDADLPRLVLEPSPEQRVQLQVRVWWFPMPIDFLVALIFYFFVAYCTSVLQFGDVRAFFTSVHPLFVVSCSRVTISSVFSISPPLCFSFLFLSPYMFPFHSTSATWSAAPPSCCAIASSA